MVLILAGDWDPLARAVREELERRGCDHATLGEDWAAASELVWTPDPFGGSMQLGGRRVELAALDGVLARHELLMRLPGTLEPSDDLYPRFESAATLLALLDALPCPVVNRPRPLPRSRSMTLAPAVARGAGFEPLPTVVASTRDDAIAALARDGSATLVGPVSGSLDDRLVEAEAAGAAAIDALLPRGAVVIRRLAPAPRLTAFVAGETVVGPPDLDAAAAAAARALARQLGVQLLRITFQQSDGRLWLVDADVHPFLPGGTDAAQLVPVAAGVSDVLAGPAG